jgi:hypothetical protein
MTAGPVSAGGGMKRWILRPLAWGAFAAIIYAALSLAAFAVSLVMLQRGTVSSVPLLRQYQHFAYQTGTSRVWHGDRNCVEFDERLLYKPKIGECRFDSQEFKTTIGFDAEGRRAPSRPSGPGIAVVGDSHAMGWGVNDGETFAVHLQKMMARPVYNLGVASYATFRELTRLERSGLLGRVDTVVIQYCDNDLEENTATVGAHRRYTREQFEAIFTGARQGSHALVTAWVIEALNGPLRDVPLLRAIKERISPSRPSFQDFRQHFDLIQRTLAEFPWLRDKRVILFYVNAYGRRFSNFGEVAAARSGDAVEFVDLDVAPEYFLALDGHLNAAGHERVAAGLAAVLAKR